MDAGSRIMPQREAASIVASTSAGMPVKLLYGLGRYVDLTADISFMGLPTPTTSLSSGTGTAWGYGGGLRLKGPHDSDGNSDRDNAASLSRK